MSHEISESFNDPFLNNITPRWQFPGEPGVCQRHLESGDPVEVLAHPAFPVTLSIDNEDAAPGWPTSLLPSTRTEALVQWFTQTSPWTRLAELSVIPEQLPGPALPCTP